MLHVVFGSIVTCGVSRAESFCGAIRSCSASSRRFMTERTAKDEPSGEHAGGSGKRMQHLHRAQEVAGSAPR